MDKGRMSLRRKQWQAVENGNTTMLVWLGKQYLRQKDKVSDDDREDSQPLEVKVTIEDSSKSK